MRPEDWLPFTTTNELGHPVTDWIQTYRWLGEYMGNEILFLDIWLMFGSTDPDLVNTGIIIS